MRRLHGGLAAGMRHRHAGRTLSAIPTHVLATLLLISRKLRVGNGARHDRPSQEEDNEQWPKMDSKFHKLSSTTAR